MSRLPLINYTFSQGAAKNSDGSQAGQPHNATYIRANASLPDWGTLSDALSFRGSGSFLSVPLQPPLRATTGFAIEMAIRLASLGEDRMNLFQGWMPGCSLNLRLNGSGYSLRGGLNTPQSWQGIQTELPVIMPNVWASVALVQAGDDLTIFVNGKAVARRVFRPAVLVPIQDRDFAMGCFPDGPAWQFVGDVAGLRIWGEVPPHLEQSLAEAERTGLGNVESRYLDLLGPTGALGAPLSSEQSVGRGRMRSFAGGDIFWSPERGVHVVQGGILAHYRKLGGPTGVLGFPITDEEDRPALGARVSIFESGAIYWTQADGTHEVQGEIFLHYAYLGAAKGPLGLPLSNELISPVGRRSQFKGGTIFWSTQTGASALSGDILNCYVYQLGGTKGSLGMPVSGINDVLTREGNVTGGKMACFQNGSIYQGRNTGSHAVQGDILALYQQMGGPTGKLGYPKSNEQGVPNTDVRYNDFENGVIFWTPQKGARCLTALQLHLGMVRSGYINDGYSILPPAEDHSAEVVVHTTVNVNGQARETNVQKGGHHGTSYDINSNYDVSQVNSATSVDFEIRVTDYDSASNDEYLATLKKRFDISNCWGLNNELKGVYIGQQATDRGKDAPRPDSVLFDYRIGPPSEIISPDEPFRERQWWDFDNFPTQVLSRRTYANTFQDVEFVAGDWEKFVHLGDTLFYELVYKGLAEHGNCFGNSLEAQFALAGRSVFAEPIRPQYPLQQGVADLINIRHGFQVSGAHIRWIIARMFTLDVVRPSKIYERVRATLSSGQKTLISFADMPDVQNGHTVLAYDCEDGKGGQPHRIFVADPNVWRFFESDPRPSVVEIAGDTFKFVTKNDENKDYVMFKSKPMAGFSASTFMFDSPFHVFSCPPRTGFWESIAALVGFVGMYFIFGGDADTVALKADGADYYKPTGGGLGIVPNAIPSFSRIPFFDAGRTAPELYAQSGYPAQKIETTVRGRQGAGGARRFQYGMCTTKNSVVLDSPIAANSNDHLSLSGARSSAPLLEATTDEAAKTARLTYSVMLDDRRRAACAVEADWRMARGATSRFGASPHAAGFIIEQAGAAAPTNLTFTTIENGKARRSILRLPANPANRVLRMRPLDWVSPHSNMVVEGLESFDGGVIARFTGIVSPVT